MFSYAGTGNGHDDRCRHIAHLADGADVTTSATIRRTSGNTVSSVGNATSHDKAQAPGQVARNACVGPRLLKVEIIETTKVISTDRTSGITTGA